MKKARSIAITLALIWILVKLVFFFLGRSTVGFEVGVLVNMLFILITIASTLWFKYREVTLVESTFLDDLKDTMKHAGIYIVLVLSFTFIFLKVIEPDFLESKVREAVQAITEHLEVPGNLEEIKAQSPSPETVTKQDIIERTEETRRQLFSVGVTMSLSLFALFAVSMLYSVLTTLLFRKVLLK